LPRDPAALPSLVVRWSRPHPAEGGSPESLPMALWREGGVVALGDHIAGQVVALALADGRELWRHPMPRPIEDAFSATMAVDARGVLYQARDRWLEAVDLRDGRALWLVDLPGTPEWSTPPLLTAGVVVLHVEGRTAPDEVVSASSRVVAVDTSTGAIAWTLEVPNRYGLPMTEAGEQVALAAGPRSDASPERSEVRLVGAFDGARVASREVEGQVSDLFAAGELLVVRAGERLTALRLPSLEPAWDRNLPGGASVVGRQGSSLLVLSGATLRRVELATGNTLAETDLAGVIDADDGAECVEDLAPAGNSLVFATGPRCGRRHVVLLRGETLRPWRVMMAPYDGIDRLEAGAETAILVTGAEVVAIDLADEGPPLTETATFGERIAQVGREIEAGRLPLGWPLEDRAREFALGGPELGPALVEVLEHGQERPAERLFVATVLQFHREPAAVPGLIALFLLSTGAAGGADPDPATELDEQIAWRTLEALARCGDARALPLLTRLLTEPRWPEGARSLAMQGLTSIGTPEALAVIDDLRTSRSRRAAPWAPEVHEGTSGRRFDDAGMFGAAGPNPAAEEAGPRAESPDGNVVALVAYAAGGVSDLWLRSTKVAGGAFLFTGVTSTYGLGIYSVTPTRQGADVVISRSLSGPSCAVCAMMEAQTAPPAAGSEGRERPAKQRAALRWAELTRDSDRDGWTDLLEKRLHTDPARADTDGDSLADGVDPAPRGAGPSSGGACAREAVLTAAFFAEFGFAEGAAPIFVEGPSEVNLQYEGYAGPVIYVTSEEAEALRAEVGLDGAAYFSFAQRYEEGPDGDSSPVGSPLDAVEFSPDGTRAVVNVSEYRGSLNAVGNRIELTCLQGRWYPVSVTQTWIS
jgi:outer membrane protein assembly factor BamB